MAALVVATILMSLLCTSSAYNFAVGGRDGWSPNPKESFNNWAERMRFQVNDNLVFKYKKDDSVLVVKKEDYDSCNVQSPIQRLQGGGSSVFQFSRSGPFYFISGVESNCKQGEKLAVVVLALRNNRPILPPPPTSSPSPSSPPSNAPPSPPSLSPSTPPSNAPLSPLSQSPSPSTAPIVSPSNSPSKAPTTSPPSPSAPLPSSPKGSPMLSPGSAGGPTGSTPGAAPAPTPKPSSSSVFSVSRLSIGLVILVLGHVSHG